MPAAPESIAHVLDATQKMLHLYVDDLRPEEFLHRPCAGGNCAAWIVGHLTNVDRRALRAIGVEPPDVPAGFEDRFTTKGDAPKANDFGDPKDLIAQFDNHRVMLIAGVKKVDPAKLDGPAPFTRPMFTTVGEMINFFGAHTAMHAGQITVIRRSLGRPPIV